MKLLCLKLWGNPIPKWQLCPPLVLGTPKESPRGHFKRASMAFNKHLIDVSFGIALPLIRAAGHRNNKNISKWRSWRHWQTESRPCWWLSFWVLSGEAGCLSLGRNILYHCSFCAADGLGWVQGLSMETSKGLPRGKCQSRGLVKSNRNWWALSGRMYVRCMLAAGADWCYQT